MHSPPESTNVYNGVNYEILNACSINSANFEHHRYSSTRPGDEEEEEESELLKQPKVRNQN